MNPCRTLFAAGRVHIATPEEELAVLRERVEQAEKDLAAHDSEQNEYRLARAEVDLEEFLEWYPELEA